MTKQRLKTIVIIMKDNDVIVNYKNNSDTTIITSINKIITILD